MMNPLSAMPAPRARRSLGRAVKEWYDTFEAENWTRSRLKEFAVDPASAPLSKVIAALDLLYATSFQKTKTGTPVCGPHIDRIMDRTEGKPVQTQEVTMNNGEPTCLIVNFGLVRPNLETNSKTVKNKLIG